MTGPQLHLNALHYNCLKIASQLHHNCALYHNCITTAHCATIHYNEQSLELTAHAPHQLANQTWRCINKSPQPVFRGLFPPLSPIFLVEWPQSDRDVKEVQRWIDDLSLLLELKPFAKPFFGRSNYFGQLKSNLRCWQATSWGTAASDNQTLNLLRANLDTNPCPKVYQLLGPIQWGHPQSPVAVTLYQSQTDRLQPTAVGRSIKCWSSRRIVRKSWASPANPLSQSDPATSTYNEYK